MFDFLRNCRVIFHLHHSPPTSGAQGSDVPTSPPRCPPPSLMTALLVGVRRSKPTLTAARCSHGARPKFRHPVSLHRAFRCPQRWWLSPRLRQAPVCRALVLRCINFLQLIPAGTTKAECSKWPGTSFPPVGHLGVDRAAPGCLQRRGGQCSQVGNPRPLSACLLPFPFFFFFILA